MNVPTVTNHTTNSSSGSTIAARDDIMKQIASQAASVRRTFEAHPSKRKHTVSSATAAAAQHMASLNRKRKFENDLANRADQGGCVPPPPRSKSNNHTFHSPIATFTRPEKVRTVRSVSNNITQHPLHEAPPSATAAPASSIPPTGNSSSMDNAQQAPRVSDGIVLKASPHDITVSYNDVVCGKGKTTSSLVGNQRYKVWISLYKDSFAKAYSDEEKRNIAIKIVNAVCTGVPAGRFLSLDIYSGLWYVVGYERAVGITMETLMAESGLMNKASNMMVRPPVARRASMPRVFTSKAA